MTVDPTERGAQYKREQIAKFINLSEEQRIIIDLYILEEKTRKRHWELDPEDNNIYLEWLNGTEFIRNKINNSLNMTRAQKIAMNNKSQQQTQGIYGNNPQQIVQAPQPQQQQERIIRTSSGKEYKASERPDLLPRPRHSRYPRHNR